MNDNQYIAHSSEIICHSGKKGMKWGQGPYSKLKGYVKKTYDDASKFVDEKITGSTAQKRADRYRRDADWYENEVYKPELERLDMANSELRYYDREIGKRKLAINAPLARPEHKKMAEKELKMLSKWRNDSQRSADNHTKWARSDEQYIRKQRINAAYNQHKANKSLAGKTKKLYRVVKTKAGQLFGKPKLG